MALAFNQPDYKAVNIITPVGKELLILDEVKKHLRIDVDMLEDDSMLTDILIPLAREYCEDFTHRAIGVQTFELVLDNFPLQKDFIELPRSPLLAIESFTYKNSQGITQEVDKAIYFVDKDFKPGKVCLNYNRYWPIFIPFPYASVRIKFTAGHSSDDLPKRIKQAMMLLIGHLYEHREEVTTEKYLENVPVGVKALLWPLRVF
jgi:uncharacterized phiE125 gp8 family phage protein